MDQCSQYALSFGTVTLVVFQILAATHCFELNGTSSNTDYSYNDTELIETSYNQSNTSPLLNESNKEKTENILDAQAYSLALSSNRSTKIQDVLQNISQDSLCNISTIIEVCCLSSCCNQTDVNNRDYRSIPYRPVQKTQYNCSQLFAIITDQTCRLNFTLCIYNFTDTLRLISGNTSDVYTPWLEFINKLSVNDIDDCNFSFTDIQNDTQTVDCILLNENGSSENASIYDIPCDHITCRADTLKELCVTYICDNHIQVFDKSCFCDENIHQPKCSEHCNDGYCNNTTGECSSCKFGWFGNACEHRCINNCKRCIDNSTCLECIDGFYGRMCDHKCSNDCQICSKDGKVCDSCKTNNDFGPQCACKVNQCFKYSPMLRCLECKQPGWYVSLGGCCPCSHNCVGGFASCDNITGSCSDGCIDEYYGDTCSDKCSTHCLEKPTKCNSLTGECANGCEQNWYSSTCSYECPLFYPYCELCSNTTDFGMKCVKCMDGYYMPQKYSLTDNERSYLSGYCFPCNHCLNKTCDGYNGICTKGCKLKGHYNSDDFILGEKNCVLECISCWNQNCDFINGTCLDGCVHGLYGSHCDLTCSESCVYSTCDQSSGDCLSCNVGNYGPWCKSSCGHCEKNGCDQYTGECDGNITYFL
ncbi:neurogenic locus notch homolog protein 1-like [Mytilus trossulus]|uniref:neurogenic locus notch homolog protein 1-like n=1 Tax=Mytilus trossulus TaxID=6551 RepID=UPI0030070746